MVASSICSSVIQLMPLALALGCASASQSQHWLPLLLLGENQLVTAPGTV